MIELQKVVDRLQIDYPPLQLQEKMGVFSGEQRLWAAVLNRAVSDSLPKTEVKWPGSRFGRLERVVFDQSARDWFRDSSEEVGSFSFICQNLGIMGKPALELMEWLWLNEKPIDFDPDSVSNDPFLEKIVIKYNDWEDEVIYPSVSGCNI